MTISLFFVNSRLLNRYKNLTLYADSSFASGPSPAIKSARVNRLTYNTRNFTLNGKPIRLVSGSVHYFRFPPSQWGPVLRLARQMGLNAIETYVPWNLHEPIRGRFRFSGMLDLRRFLEEAHAAGLLVLLRPGPYICSEWDLGGLPSFLLSDPKMRLRSSYKPFVAAAARYIAVIARVVEPYIGKPVVGLQIENEFGAFHHPDRDYMITLRTTWRRAGLSERNVMLFTSDNGDVDRLRVGSPFDSREVLKTINFGGHVRKRFATLRQAQPNAPAMVGELWTGWFDHWGEKHHTRPADEVTAMVEEVLFQQDGSVNLYMFFGGTNFGFMAGANTMDNETYQPDTTSYDYDAFITEAGEVRRHKFLPMQKLLSRFWKMMGDEEMLLRMRDALPMQPLTSAYAGPVPLKNHMSLFDVLPLVSDAHVNVTYPKAIEIIGGTYGYSLYRTTLKDEQRAVQRAVVLHGVRDFAYVIADGRVVQTVDRNREMERLSSKGESKTVMVPGETRRLDIFVEHGGRVNYGLHLHDRKGLLGNVSVDGSVLSGFEVFGMSFAQDHSLLRDVLGRSSVSDVRAEMTGRESGEISSDSGPRFFHGTLSVNPGAREALGGELPGSWIRVFGRGTLWVNGFNAGRFHTGVSGPQRSLFVPGCVLREGVNDIMVLHTNMRLTKGPYKVQLFEQADFGRGSQI